MNAIEYMNGSRALGWVRPLVHTRDGSYLSRGGGGGAMVVQGMMVRLTQRTSSGSCEKCGLGEDEAPR